MRLVIKTKDIIFLSFALFFLGGSTYLEGSIFLHGFKIVTILVSFPFFIKSLALKPANLAYQAWTAFFLINVFGFLLTADVANERHLGMFLVILTNYLVFYPVYYWTIKGKFFEKDVLRFFFIMLPVTILNFYANAESFALRFGVEDVVNSVAYLFVFLLPYVFLIRSRLFSFIFLLIIVFFIVESSKRGAIVLGVIGVFFFFYFHIKSNSGRQRLSGYGFALLSILAVSYFSYDLVESNEYLLRRFSYVDLNTGEGSSGRNIIYENIFNQWYDSNSFVNYLLGFGFAGSLALAGQLAHNDWLELLSNFGLLGVASYLSLLIILFFYVSKMDVRTKIISYSILSIWLISTLFSMNYVSGYSFPQSIILAYFLAKQCKYDFVFRSSVA